MNMKLSIETLQGVAHTGATMEKFVRLYYTDCKHLFHCSLQRYFDLIKNLPYIADPHGIEFVSRPALTLTNKTLFRDCDDKAVLIGCYLYHKNIPFRFIAVSEKPTKELHHTLVEVQTEPKAYIDATYSKNRLFKLNKPFTRKDYISGVIKKG